MSVPAIRIPARQRRILELCVQDYTHSAIGTQLGITKRTVEKELARVRNLFGVSSTLCAIAVAHQLRIIDIDEIAIPRHQC